VLKLIISLDTIKDINVVDTLRHIKVCEHATSTFEPTLRPAKTILVPARSHKSHGSEIDSVRDPVRQSNFDIKMPDRTCSCPQTKGGCSAKCIVL